MALENKLNITDSAELAREEERINKKKDVEIKVLLKAALTDEINDCTVYMKGIHASYHSNLYL